MCKNTLNNYYVTGLPPFCLIYDAVWLSRLTTINRDNPYCGYERNLIMKKTTYKLQDKIGAAVLSSAMIFALTACSQPVYRLDNPSANSVPTSVSQSSETPASSKQANTGSVKADPEAYSSLLAALESAELTITMVTWMNVGHDDSNWLFPKDNITCALADVTGDGTEELLVLEGNNRMQSTLQVFSYSSATKDVSVILTVEGLNMQGDAARGVVIGVTKDGKLIVIDCPRETYEYTMCMVYKYNGKELEVETSVADVVSVVDEITNPTHTYKINDNNVSVEEYNAKLDEIVNSMDRLLQYAFVCGDQFKKKVATMTSEAKNFDDMHDYLKGLVN